MNIQYPKYKAFTIYAAQSPKDFIAKMSIASKETRESNYWLRLLDKSDYLNNYPNKLVLFNMS